MMQTYRVIGIMSGTSMDGVDLALCQFTFENERWSFEIVKAETIPYTDEWRKKLSALHSKDAFTLANTHVEYGHFLGNLVKTFMARHSLSAGFVSSHGHTIFHQPHKKLTLQVGEGAALSAACGLPVVCDFRTMDVALGGQGAPLVPIGDKLLFAEYDYCLNLGGIANISFENNNERIAFDVCPANMVLNYLAQQKGKTFDKDGHLAACGRLNDELLSRLNRLAYYTYTLSPKTLGREDIERDFFPLLEASSLSIADKLATFCEHIAMQVASSINTKHQTPNSKLLISGGGALNIYLSNRLKELCEADIIIPEKTILEFKEALIFAFLGVLRMRGEVNCLKSVTGAEQDSCGGAVFGISG